MEYDRTSVETDAGTYVIVEHYDTDAPYSPLVDYDHDGMTLYVYERNSSGWDVAYSNVDDGTPVGNALSTFISDHGGYGAADDVERRMSKWLALTGAAMTFHAGSVNRQSGVIYYLAVVDDTYPDPSTAVRATMTEYRDWADGNVYGYVAETPAGEEIASCWGFIGDSGRDEMMSQARAEVDYDARQRVSTANLVGSGIVGLI